MNPNYELKNLEREKKISESTIEYYKNDLIDKLPPVNEIVEKTHIYSYQNNTIKPKKTLFKRLLSMFG